MRLRRTALAAAFLSFVVFSFASVAGASPAANMCDRTSQEVAAADTIVRATASGVSTVEKDGTRYVRVAYTVDRTLKGKAARVVVVEETCRVGSPRFEELGYPGIASYCDVGLHHAMPGLNAQGQPDGSAVTLRLVGTKSELDGRSLRRVVRISPWSRCP